MKFLCFFRAIIHHFTPKIDAWSQDNSKVSLSEEEVSNTFRLWTITYASWHLFCSLHANQCCRGGFKVRRTHV